MFVGSGTATFAALITTGVGTRTTPPRTGTGAVDLPGLTITGSGNARDISADRDVTITITGPVGHPLTATGPTGHPFSATGPRS